MTAVAVRSLHFGKQCLTWLNCYSSMRLCTCSSPWSPWASVLTAIGVPYADELNVVYEPPTQGRLFTTPLGPGALCDSVTLSDI